MRFAIDCRFWGPADTGLGIYTKNLVTRLIKIDHDNEYILISNKDLEIDLPKNFKSHKVSVSPYSLIEQIIYPFILYSLNVDLVHFPSINVPILYFKDYVVTIHDLIKHHSRGMATTTRSAWLYWLKYLGYLSIFKLIVHQSKAIIVPTDAVKNDLLKTYKISQSKIYRTYESANFTSELVNKSTFQVSAPEKFAIYTGNAYPHKNLEALVSIWPEIYSQTKTKLLLVGARNVFATRLNKIIESNGANDFVLSLGFVQDSDLAGLYLHAQIYVFPSKLEGFGLPGLDAMLCGLPVVCSDIPVLRETYGQAAIYFDPNSNEDMKKIIIESLKDSKLRQQKIALGKEKVKEYSWERMARETNKVYESCTSI